MWRTANRRTPRRLPRRRPGGRGVPDRRTPRRDHPLVDHGRRPVHRHPGPPGRDHRADAAHAVAAGRAEGQLAVLGRPADQRGGTEAGRAAVAGRLRLPPPRHHLGSRLRLHRSTALPLRLPRPPAHPRRPRPVGRLRAAGAAAAPPAGLAGPVAARRRRGRGRHRRRRHRRRPDPGRREHRLPDGLVRPV